MLPHVKCNEGLDSCFLYSAAVGKGNAVPWGWQLQGHWPQNMFILSSPTLFNSVEWDESCLDNNGNIGAS